MFTVYGSLMCIKIRIGCKKPIVDILKMYQSVFGDAPGLHYTKNQSMRSSNDHEPPTVLLGCIRAGEPGHFANLGRSLTSLRSRDFLNKTGSILQGEAI